MSSYLDQGVTGVDFYHTGGTMYISTSSIVSCLGSHDESLMDGLDVL